MPCLTPPPPFRDGAGLSGGEVLLACIMSGRVNCHCSCMDLYYENTRKDEITPFQNSKVVVSGGETKSVLFTARMVCFPRPSVHKVLWSPLLTTAGRLGAALPLHVSRKNVHESKSKMLKCAAGVLVNAKEFAQQFRH